MSGTQAKVKMLRSVRRSDGSGCLEGSTPMLEPGEMAVWTLLGWCVVTEGALTKSELRAAAPAAAQRLDQELAVRRLSEERAEQIPSIRAVLERIISALS